MPGLFDSLSDGFDYEGDEPPENQRSLEQQQDGVDRVLDELSDESVDDELKEAEKKLNKAAYYRAIVRSGVMEDDGSQAASEVNAEARLWARHQMAKLLGGSIAAAPVVQQQAQFNEKELMVLKKLIERTLMIQGERPAEPSVKKVQTPIQPMVRKQQPVANAPTKKVAPVASQAKKPVAPAPSVSSSGKPRILRPKLVNGAVNYDAIPMGEIFRDPTTKDLYKFVPHPSEEGKRSRIKIHLNATNPAALPMPSVTQMPGISAAQSMEAVDSGRASNTIFPDAGEKGTDIFVAAAAKSITNQ